MATLGRPLDTSNIDTSSEFDLIPVGWQPALISASDEDENKKGNGRFIYLEFTIGQGQYSGKTVKTWLNYQHTNPKAQEIALKTLKKIMDAVGVSSPLKDTSQLHNKALRVKIGIDGTYNIIDDVAPYKAETGAVAQNKGLYERGVKEEQTDAFAEDLEEPDWKK